MCNVGEACAEGGKVGEWELRAGERRPCDDEAGECVLQRRVKMSEDFCALIGMALTLDLEMVEAGSGASVAPVQR